MAEGRGCPAMTDRVVSYKYPLIKPDLGEKELEEVRKVFSSGWLTQGPYVEKFEREIAKYVGARHAVAVTSCTTALYLCLKALGIKQNDKVVVPDFTFPATANAVVELGGRPILVDVNEECGLDLNELRKVLSVHRDVNAVMLVHPFGHALNVKLYKEVISDLGLSIPMIEDAATALGSTFNGRFAGNMAECGCFSFHPRKLVAIGEGGMIVLNDDEMYEKLRILRDHGRNREGVFIFNSLNFRMSDVQATIGLVQFRKLEERIGRRRRLAELYHKLIEDIIPYARPLREKEGCRSTYQSYVIRFPREFSEHQDTIINKLRREFSIEAQIGTYALHMEPAFRSFVGSGGFPNSELLRKTTLTLPLYESMEYEDMEYIVNSVAEVCRSCLKR
jgi:dTDP-4-amino-4,6-dideoxygalactose transaminase